MTNLNAPSSLINDRPNERELERAIDLAEMVMRMGNDKSPFNARYAYHHIVSSIPYLWGADFKKMALGDDLPPTAPKREQLELLAARLETLCGDKLPDDIKMAIEDIRAMAHGDAAVFLTPAPRSGNHRTNAYRLARHQLKAHEWERLLVYHGNAAGEVQSLIAYCFGCSWDAAVKWRPTIKLMLGQGFYDKTMDMASKGNSSLLVGFKEGDSVQEWVERDGKAYQLVLAKKV